MEEKDVILIVDPDKAFAESVATLLRSNGYTVETLNDGAKALDHCQENLPQLLIIEGLIPKLNGIELAKQVRDIPKGEKVPILLISSVYAGPKFARTVKDAGINEVLAKPVTPEAFLAKVQFLLKTGEKLVPVRTIAGKEFTSTGNLSEFPFIRIVFHLYVKKETGTLRLECASVKKLITFESGEPKFVVSNLEQECLGQILVRKGRLNSEELTKSLAAMAELKKRQGETLIQMGLLEPYELDEALKQQAREKFSEIFSWRDGKFLFVPGKVFRKELTPVDLTIPQLCLRGVKEHFSLAQLQSELTNFMDGRPRIAEQPFRLEDYRLATWDIKIARQIQTGKTLSEIIGMKLSRDIDVYHLFYTLLMLGTIEVKSGTIKKVETARPATPFMPITPAAPDQSPFELLGVSDQVSDEEIRKAYDEKMAPLRDAPAWDARPTAYRRAYEMIGTLQGRRDFIIRTYQSEGKLPGEPRDIFKPAELLAIGKQFLEKKEFLRATKVFEDAMRWFKEYGIAYVYYGFAQIQAAHVAGLVDREAFEKWKRIVIRGTQVSPNEAEGHYIMGRIFSLEQDYEKAGIAFKRALSADPKFHQAEVELRLAEKRSQKKEISSVSFIKWKE